MKKNSQNKINSLGQTLIETLAAAFILTMGITASVGLAIYALNTSTGIVKQIIATGLAREGIEAVRNMRDTNWLQDTLVANSCYDFTSTPVGNMTASCYLNWLGKNGAGGPPYCINPSNGNSCNGGDSVDSYNLGFDSTAQNIWSLKKSGSSFGLNFNDPALAATWQTSGFYANPNGGVSCVGSNSGYCRKIVISKLTSPAAFNQNTGPLLEVQSEVWWVDKKCPKASDFASASVTCRIELDTYLTNWKNF
jgi:type II secretory pathway pseudopilin PulG